MKAMMQTAAAKCVVFESVWVSVLCAGLLFACTAEQDVKCGQGTELVRSKSVV